MQKDVKQFLEQIAHSLIKKDIDKVTKSFASWLDQTIAKQFEKAILKVENRTHKTWDDEDIGAADSFELDDNPCKPDELREDGVELHKDITQNNFVSWCSISIQADAGEWFLYDLWCAVVKEKSKFIIGYFEVEDPD